jgi:hypothetical protein
MTSASTVGLPRESMICLPCTRAIFVDMPPPGKKLKKMKQQMNTDEREES